MVDDPKDPQGWYQVPGVCGSCIAWRSDAARPGEETAQGICKLRPELGRVGADLRKCDRYMPRGSFTYQPGSRPLGDKRRRSKVVSVARRAADGARRAADGAGSPQAPRPSASPEALPLPFPRGEPPPATLDLGTESLPVVEQALRELIRGELGRSGRELHPKFRGGHCEVRTASGETLGIRMESFFARLDHLAQSLAELEKAFAPHLPAEELQEIMGRIRGSLTTFNAVFFGKEDHFKSG